MAKKEDSRKQKQKSGKWDYSKTIRVLYGVALGLAIVACVMIGVKTYEDLSSEKSANTLLEAYLKNQEQQYYVTLSARKQLNMLLMAQL